MKEAIAGIFVLCLIVWAIISCGNWLDSGPWGWDGWIAEPGCDWGNPNCTMSDYKHMCETFDGNVKDARWIRYCEGRFELR